MISDQSVLSALKYSALVFLFGAFTSDVGYALLPSSPLSFEKQISCSVNPVDLASNGSFEDLDLQGPVNWTLEGLAQISDASEDVHSGFLSVRLQDETSSIVQTVTPEESGQVLVTWFEKFDGGFQANSFPEFTVGQEEPFEVRIGPFPDSGQPFQRFIDDVQVLFCPAGFTPTATPTSTLTHTFTPTPTSTPSNTPTNTSTPTPSPTATFPPENDVRILSPLHNEVFMVGEPIPVIIEKDELAPPGSKGARFFAPFHLMLFYEVLGPGQTCPGQVEPATRCINSGTLVLGAENRMIQFVVSGKEAGRYSFEANAFELAPVTGAPPLSSDAVEIDVVPLEEVLDARANGRIDGEDLTTVLNAFGKSEISAGRVESVLFNYARMWYLEH